MIITGITFFNSVFTVYSFHRNAFKDDGVFKYAQWLHAMWFTYFLVITIMTIYVSAEIINKVCIVFYRIPIIKRFLFNHIHFHIWQGKTTSRIVHDISNCCTNAEVIPSVKKL